MLHHDLPYDLTTASSQPPHDFLLTPVRLLDLVKPFLPILPEVEMPLQRVVYDEKLLWFVSTGIIYFVMNELPLYGAKAGGSLGDGPLPNDPLYWLRPVFASTKGSLLELGVLPILSAGFIMQILGGNHWIDVNFDLISDRILFQSAQKLLALFFALVEALAVVFSGAYGTPQELGTSGIFWIVLQLFMGAVVLILLSEVLEKDYGFGSGVTFFGVIHICQLVAWRAFSLSWQTLHNGRGSELLGALSSFGYMLWTRNFKTALLESFYRTHLPNLFDLYAAIFAFGIIVYLLNFRVELPIKSTKARSQASSYPVRLLYVGGLPVYIVTVITANLFLISVALYNLFPYSLFVRLIGTWESRQGYPQLHAVSGLAYFLQPPFSLKDALWDPIRTIVYGLFLVVTTTLFAGNWAYISGTAPKDIAKTFKLQGIVLAGKRDVSISKELGKVIPVAASVGGAIVGLLMFGFDISGTPGVAAALIVATTGIFGYYELLAQENGFPGMSGAL